MLNANPSRETHQCKFKTTFSNCHEPGFFIMIGELQLHFLGGHLCVVQIEFVNSFFVLNAL